VTIMKTAEAALHTSAMVPLVSPIWPMLPDEAIEAVHEALVRSRWDSSILNGLRGIGSIEEFEAAFGAFLKAPHVLATSSGAAALHLALITAGVSPDDEVILSSYGWGQVLVFVDALDAIPVFADIDPDTLGLDPSSVAERITEQTRAVIVTHHAGCPAAVPKIAEIARQVGATVIEDSAQALGACIGECPVGTVGDLGVFSFGPRKHLPLGEGGALVASDPALLSVALISGQHPDRAAMRIPDPRCFGSADEFFWPYRMHPVAAVLGQAMLPFIPIWHEERRRNVEYLVEQLAAVTHLSIPGLAHAPCHAWAHVPLTYRHDKLDTKSRHKYTALLRASGVELTIGPVRQPLHLRHSVISRWGSQPPCPVAEQRCASQELALLDAIAWIGDQTEFLGHASVAFHRAEGMIGATNMVSQNKGGESWAS